MEIEADLASATALYTMSSTVDGQQQHAALTAPSTPPPSYAPTDIPRHPATRLPTPTKARAKARERTRARVVVVAQDPATPPLASAPVSGWCSNLAILLQPVDGLHLHVARTAIFSDAATSTTCVPGYTEALCPPPPADPRTFHTQHLRSRPHPALGRRGRGPRGSTISSQLLQRHGRDPSHHHRLGGRLWSLQPNYPER
jgi:hypothetical protein